MIGPGASRESLYRVTNVLHSFDKKQSIAALNWYVMSLVKGVRLSYIPGITIWSREAATTAFHYYKWIRLPGNVLFNLKSKFPTVLIELKIVCISSVNQLSFDFWQCKISDDYTSCTARQSTSQY